MSNDGVERELKFSGVDHNELRDRLSNLEAECQGSPALEENWIFDSNNQLSEEGRLLRLRKDKRGALITLKGPASYEQRVKVRTELETGIDDVEKMRAILESLGFGLVRRYQKYREEWLLGSIVISLDHTPIGDFAEFEGEGCEKVALRSGLDPEKSERRNYLRLYEEFLKENPDAPKDMVFP